jgi:MSHA biogenesis protein MshM
MMYQSHFGLREEPFGVTPDGRFFYQSAQHREALATLFYAIEQRRGFALLLGGAGLGKTSVLFTLTQMLQARVQIAYLANPYYDRATVLDAVLASLGLEPGATPATSHKAFYQYLSKIHASGRTVAVFFDEAQDLNRDTLEAIRMLSNFETPGAKLMQIVLAGQPRLAETLAQADCEQIRQRLSAVARLEPLEERGVPEYMAHRLQTAGGSIEIFTSGAVERIASASRGVPRNVNTICYNSLALAYALGKRQVGIEEVTEALRDLELPGVDGGPPQARTVEPAPDVAKRARTHRAAWIAGGVALLAAAALVLGRFWGWF